MVGNDSYRAQNWALVSIMWLIGAGGFWLTTVMGGGL